MSKSGIRQLVASGGLVALAAVSAGVPRMAWADGAAAPVTAASTPVAPKVLRRQSSRSSSQAGYRVEERNGEKYYCRREYQLNSRLRKVESCFTAAELERVTEASHDTLNNMSRRNTSPKIGE